MKMKNRLHRHKIVLGLDIQQIQELYQYDDAFMY